MYTVIEEIPTTTLLGIRFWDPVLDQQVRGGLRVRAWPVRSPTRSVGAFRTLSDVYAFNRLPGLRALEHAPEPPGTLASPPVAERFVIEVQDLEERYLPIAHGLDVPLPYRGLLLNGLADSPPGGSVQGFHLHAAPTRAAPAWLGVVRAELEDIDTGAPAAHAVLEVHLPGGGRWQGIADAAGRVTVLLPYPAIVGGAGPSPMALGARQPLAEQSWDLRIEVSFDPGTLADLPGTDLPELVSILRQPPGLIFPSPLGAGLPAMHETLGHRQPLVLRSLDRAELLVGTAPSSP